MTASPPQERFNSSALLVDLVMNPLDPGYAAAAARRATNPGRRWYDAPAVAFGCALVGFVLVIAYIHTHRSAPAAARVHDSLVARVHASQDQDRALSKQVQQLTGQLQKVRTQALPGSGGLVRQLNADQVAAGQTAVTGPGLTVTLSEPPKPTASPAGGRGGSVPISATNILTDRDVRSVVNELWADGAEAIAVNGLRLSPTSAIRFAGDAVLVDYQAISPPFRIEAVGTADDLATSFAASDVAGRYQTLVGADGIGFGFAESKLLHLPASAPRELRYAK